MTPRLINHIGILVEDLEAAIARWSAASDYTFTPIARYRTDRYSDRSDPELHSHDARVSFSEQGPPYIELMEYTGEGTHSSSQGEGVHHLGFTDHPDVAAQLQHFADIGMLDDGRVVDDNGKVILWFTEKSQLNGLRLEFVSTDPQPVVKDDGSPWEGGV